MAAWSRAMGSRLYPPRTVTATEAWCAEAQASRSARRLPGHDPRAVMTAIEDVTGRKACSRLAEVLQAQPRVTASTQRNRGPLDSVFDAGVAQHGPISFRRRHASWRGADHRGSLSP